MLRAEAGRAPAEGIAGRQHDHFVTFYDSDRFLVDSVATFLAPAMEADDAALVIATPDHCGDFEAALARRGVDVAGARARDQWTALDAAETLATFMVDSWPDQARFHAVVGRMVDAAARDGRRVHIYGEMVALSWAAGNVSAALELEGLWNELAAARPFALLCAYPMRVFDQVDDATAFRTLCGRHSVVIPTESYSELADTDERRREVAALQQASRAGSRKLATLTRQQCELEAALERLRELDGSRNEYLAMIAHDIQTPTAVVSGYLDLLRDRWSQLAEDEAQELLDHARDSSKRIERLVADILTAARIDAGAFTYRLRPLDLGRVVQRAVEGARRATGRSIEVTRDADLPAALADEDRQTQILSNLLTNALKFSPGTSTVEVKVTDDGDRLVVSVRDEGDGIDPDDQVVLFRPFSRLGRGHRSESGTGLGLYTAAALIEGQGGTIWVDSAAGEGSTFFYTVPTAPSRS